jgi:hypothetical protein
MFLHLHCYVFESFNPTTHEPPAKKPKRSYDKFQIIQDSWVAKFPWVELVLGEDFQVSLVKSMICLVVEEKDKSLLSNLDTLHKHVGWKRLFVTFVGIVIRD